MKMVAAAKYARAERALKPARVYGTGALCTLLKAHRSWSFDAVKEQPSLYLARDNLFYGFCEYHDARKHPK